ncbi:MAG: hypothetical protein QN168_14990 [Armatimonadota bacterium]|nr:hypothetical protein [Armatimonadota bacterium]
MIDSTRFDLIKRKHGAYASWAVWAPPTGGPKSNVGDLKVLDPQANPRLLKTLNPAVVMVGLNIARDFQNEPFRNFHDPSPCANDFKIRFAFRDTPYWGAYMTDVIKGYVAPESGQLLDYLRAHPQFVVDHVESLRAELLDLGHPRPMILAFGGAAYSLLEQNLSRGDYSLLVKLTHYSHRISQEKYRVAVHEEIVGAQLWEAIEPVVRQRILSNVWCGECGMAVSVVEWTVRARGDSLIVTGKCKRCRSKVRRFVENATED